MSVLNMDCIEGMRMFSDNSFDSIVTDPPYELTSARPGGRSPATEGRVMKGFMGMVWDGTGIANNVEMWAEALRVLKPGGHLLAFSGSRTYHRMVCAIEDAGFEIRDQIMWVYGSGFPKSRNLDGDWQGWGTALKPAHEPIVVARKPLVGTVAANVLQHGTGALNIDACRVPTDDALGGGAEKRVAIEGKHEGWARPWMHEPDAVAAHAARVTANVEKAEALGRWPANLIHDGSEEVVAAFPHTESGIKNGGQYGRESGVHEGGQRVDGTACYGDKGSAARFFYCAKASRSDRNEGAENHHPTVKPTDLMRYLVRLVTPPGGLVLDPFTGSGSTGKACVLEGFQFVGFELSAEYAAIAKARIDHAAL